MRSPGIAGPPCPTTAAASVVSIASAGGVSTLPQACGVATWAGRAPRRSCTSAIRSAIRSAVPGIPEAPAAASGSGETPEPVTQAAFAITAAAGSANAARTANATAWLVPAGRLPRSSVQLDPAATPAHDHRTSLAPASKLDSAGTVSVSTAAPRSWLPLFAGPSSSPSTSHAAPATSTRAKESLHSTVASFCKRWVSPRPKSLLQWTGGSARQNDRPAPSAPSRRLQTRPGERGASHRDDHVLLSAVEDILGYLGDERPGQARAMLAATYWRL